MLHTFEVSMKKIVALVLGLSASAWALAAQPLLSPAELNARLKDPAVRVIDIRDAKAYGEQHIPGAVNAPYGSWRGAPTNPGELPELPKLTALVQSLGLTPSSHAVVVSSGADATDFGAAARVYWTLKALGLKELSVVNGGVKAWSQAGLPLNNAPVTVAASKYAPQLDHSLIATKDDVAEAVKTGQSQLVDARPAEFFEGDTRHAAAKVPGTIKGAKNLEHDTWFVSGGALLKSADEVKKLLLTTPLDAKKDTVSFCNTGHWAATNWFALSEVAGIKNVKLYAGSLVDWTQDSRTLPMDNVPSRVKQLAIDAKLWAEKNAKK